MIANFVDLLNNNNNNMFCPTSASSQVVIVVFRSMRFFVRATALVIASVSMKQISVLVQALSESISALSRALADNQRDAKIAAAAEVTAARALDSAKETAQEREKALRDQLVLMEVCAAFSPQITLFPQCVSQLFCGGFLITNQSTAESLQLKCC